MLVTPSITKQLNIVSIAVIIVQVFQPECNFRLNKQPVRQQVSPRRSRESNQSVSYASECCYRQEVQLRILPISVIFVFQPANQTEHCFTFKAALSNPTLWNFSFSFTPSRSCCTSLSNRVQREYSLFPCFHLCWICSASFISPSCSSLSTIDSYCFTFSIHAFLLLSPCCIPLSLCCHCIILSCSSFESINALPISAALKHFG